MHSTPPLRLAALVLAAPWALAHAPPALAQNGSHHYFGLAAGQGRAKFDEESLAARALSPGVTATVLERDERDRAYRVFMGWQWNRYLGAEAGYFDLGRTGFNAITVPPRERRARATCAHQHHDGESGVPFRPRAGSDAPSLGPARNPDAGAACPGGARGSTPACGAADADSDCRAEGAGHRGPDRGDAAASRRVARGLHVLARQP
jgi:hypothetical protein